MRAVIPPPPRSVTDGRLSPPARSWTEWATSGAWASRPGRALPMSPGMLGDALNLLHDPDADARALTGLVSRDPAVAARVLRLANVASSAPLTEVTSIEQAVVRLGTTTVRHAILAVCFAEWAQPSGTTQALDEVRHAVTTAFLARYVAEQVCLDGDVAFAQGLLHDIGRLVLLRLRTEFVRRGGDAPSADEVIEVVRDQHAHVGGLAMQLWGLPELLREAVRWHHDPLSAPDHPRAAAVIYVANRLSHRYQDEFAGSTPPEPTHVSIALPPLEDDAVFLALGLTADWLAQCDRQAPHLLQPVDQVVVH